MAQKASLAKIFNRNLSRHSSWQPEVLAFGITACSAIAKQRALSKEATRLFVVLFTVALWQRLITHLPTSAIEGILCGASSVAVLGS
eukprot:5801925-Amphidinium_carterae.1